ncbi:MAG: hypothetical protein IPL49_16095 [Saprospirales bacterium]|nr:hypothetical protein [Saprospirales bacterium]MBK8492358.1 hypothetical protein [Saprospirales bacterium]
MNLFFQFLLTVILGFVAQYFLPWWWVMAPVAFIVGLIFYSDQSFYPFLMGFFAGAILWWGMAYYLSTLNHDLLAGKMGRLFGDISPLGLEIVTGLLGGLIAGLGAMTANLGRRMLKKAAKEV